MIRRRTALILSTVLLAGCSTMIDSPFQEITLKTPGTENAHCYLDNKIGRYQIYSNQTIKIQRNDEDLKVTCYAPGNRRVETKIDRDLNAWTIANITNGIIPGVSYDHFSGAMYDYPRTISVDFGSASTGFPMPSYTSAPASQGIENYDPGVLKKNGEERIVNQPPRKLSRDEIMSRSHPLGAESKQGSGSAIEIYNP